MKNKAGIRKLKVIKICQKLKILWHFEILTWASMKNPKMCNVLKTAYRRAKRTKIWDLRSYPLHTQDTFHT